MYDPVPDIPSITARFLACFDTASLLYHLRNIPFLL